MTAAHYAFKSIEFYARELHFLFEYYPDMLPGGIIDSHITTSSYHDVLMRAFLWGLIA
jgi:hypothetical protein